MRTIAPAPTTRAMIYAAIEADAQLMAIIGNDPTRILPKAVNGAMLDIEKAKRPFYLIRLEGVGGGGLQLQRAVWVVEVHDQAGRGTLTLDTAVQRLTWTFNHARWDTPTASAERPRRSECVPGRGEHPDLHYGTIKRDARIILFGS